MTQDTTRATAQAVAKIALYLMIGYEAGARSEPIPPLQLQQGHVGVTTALATLASITHEYLVCAPVREPHRDSSPGLLEYQFLEPLGSWFRTHSTCSEDEFRQELARRLALWVSGSCPSEPIDPIEVARHAVAARRAYDAALRALEVATAGHEAGWTAATRAHVQEYLGLARTLVHVPADSALRALLAIAGSHS